MTNARKSRYPSRLEVARCALIDEAVSRGDVESIQSLTHILIPSQQYLQRALRLAISRDKIAATQCLIESGAEVDNDIALWVSLKLPSVELLELLVKASLDVNYVCTSGSILW